MNKLISRRMLPLTVVMLLVLGLSTLATAQSRRNAAPAPAPATLTFEDVMQFEEIRQPVVAASGDWIAYGVWPERGDGEVRIQQTAGNRTYTIPRGERPALSRDGRFAAALVQAPWLERENATRSNRPRTGLTLLDTRDGTTRSFEDVTGFRFTESGTTLIIEHGRPKSLDDAAKKHTKLGNPVTLVALPSAETRTLQFVTETSADSTGNWLVYAVSDTTTSANGLYLQSLEDLSADPAPVLTGELAWIRELTWDNTRSRLAFMAATLRPDAEYRTTDAALVLWSDIGRLGTRIDTLVHPEAIADGFRLRPENNLTFTRDGERLFFGVRAADMVALDEPRAKRDSVTAANMYDLNYILEDIQGDIWHWNDPLIKTNEINTFERRKNQRFTAVVHLRDNRYVQLGTTEIPTVQVAHNPDVLLGFSNLPYQQLITWDGNYNDVYRVDVRTGQAELLLEQTLFGAQVSPHGRYIAWYAESDWHLYTVATGAVRNLTSGLGASFASEDHDLPSPTPGYGIAGWIGLDEAVLINDKFDIWQISTAEVAAGRTSGATGGPGTRGGSASVAGAGSGAVNLTGGRSEHRIFRIRDFAADRIAYASGEEVLLTMYNDRRKNHGFYALTLGRPGVTRLLEDEARFVVLARANDQGGYLFTRERYDVYPNLWFSTDSGFRRTRQVTRLYEDLTRRWAWGKAELVSWHNMDGREVQGVLIYPGNYRPGERYPVLVYYYERFSQRLHQFDHPLTNHRPNFAQYASDGYAVFLPDVWFDVPLPGYSATKNLVPGVQKLVDMGVADPSAIGLHGHSWSGYLSAHVITQTNIFAAAVAGAPVSNMTSAYSGIRWGTGLARQFQYETAQSRLGVSMYDNYAPYIENSPVFFAHRINTPLLIQFGDKDDAVPWEQGIELYLAMRRLGKDAVFLQYHNELHHLRHFPNRLDYAIKMKEYFDHYLRGYPAPEWITVGQPFMGR
jgi:dipeptidyl aminopeptidase/acylaminoacyl peptidase